MLGRLRHIDFAKGHIVTTASSTRRTLAAAASPIVALEPLESRRLLSTITWTNRGLASDNFAATFGVNAGAARNVVDAVIDRYEETIASFNYTNATQLSLNIVMRPGTGFGGQTNPANVGVDASGAPRSATVQLGRGNDTDNDGNGDGNGWYLDPTPDDFAEFPNVVNGFAGTMDNTNPNRNQFDFYSLVAHEIGHAVGMTTATGSDWRDEILTLTSDSGIGDTSGNGNLWTYESSTVGQLVLTNTDLGNAGSRPVHFAVGGQSFNFDGKTWNSQPAVMNNTFQGVRGRRLLISNAQIGILDDVYGYDTVWPEFFGSMYASLDLTTNVLSLRGGTGGSNDSFRVTYLSADDVYAVSVNIGNDIPGTGPTDAYVAEFDADLVDSIDIQAGDGDDLIEIRTLQAGDTATANGGTGDDTFQIAIGDFDTNLQGNVTVIGGGGDDYVRVNDLVDGLGSDSYTFTDTAFSKPLRSLNLSSVERFRLEASDQNNTYNINAFVPDLSIFGGTGNDTFNLAQPSGRLDNMPNRMTLLGGNGDDELNLFDANDNDGDTYYFDSVGADNLNFRKSSGPLQGILYSNFDRVDLTSGSGGDVFFLRNFFADLTLNTGEGADRFYVGDGDIDANLNGDLSITAGGGYDWMRLFDQDDTGADSHSFTGNLSVGAYSKSSMTETIGYSGIDDIDLFLGDGQSNTVVVEAIPLVVDDLVITTNGFGPDTLLLGTGNALLVGANVHFDAFSNGRVIFNASGFGGNTYSLDAGGLSYSGLNHVFENVNDITLDLGPLDDNVNVGSTFGTELEIRGNDGDDDFLFANNLTAAGSATIYGGLGVDTLTLDHSGANSPLTATADQTGGLPFVSLFNGGTTFIYDSIADLSIIGGNAADTLRTILVPATTRPYLFGGPGEDQIYVDGPGTANSILYPATRIDGGPGFDDVRINSDGVGGARAESDSSQFFDFFFIASGGRYTLNESATPGEKVVRARAFNIPGRLNLTNNGLIYDHSGAAGSVNYIRDLITSGYNGGAWTGTGIYSSLADNTSFGIGYGDGQIVAPGGTFLGNAIDATAVVARFTRYGDANLDGQVNLSDFVRLRNGFGTPRALWTDGNFDYDDDTDLADFVKLRNNFNGTLP